MMRFLTHILLLCLFASPVALAQGSITLKRAARIQSGASVTLADVARFSGADAATLGAIELDLGGGEVSAVTIGLEELREAIRGAGMDPSRFSINGSTCVVRTARAIEDSAAPVAKEAEETVWTPPADASSFHGRIFRWIADSYRLDPGDLRVEWQSQDHGFLERTDTDSRLALELNSSPGAARAAIVARLWKNDSIVEVRTIRVDIQVRQRTLLATRTIDRGAMIREGDVREQVSFGRPDGAERVSEVENAIGMVTRKRIDEGGAVRAYHLEPPLLVERGQIVTMYCVRGRIEVRTEVRAKEDGVLGQVIEISRPGSREVMTARVDGPRRVAATGSTHN